MTGHTAYGLPYPDPTDPLADGANAIRALAEAIGPKVHIQSVGATSDGNGRVFAACPFMPVIGIAAPGIPSRGVIFVFNAATATGGWFELYSVDNPNGSAMISAAVVFTAIFWGSSDGGLLRPAPDDGPEATPHD